MIKKNKKLVELETLYGRNQKPEQIQMFSSGPGMDEADIPNGISQTPFTWVYHGQNFDMEFHSGFIGAELAEDEELGDYVKPVQFWAVGKKDLVENSRRR